MKVTIPYIHCDTGNYYECPCGFHSHYYMCHCTSCGAENTEPAKGGRVDGINDKLYRLRKADIGVMIRTNLEILNRKAKKQVQKVVREKKIAMTKEERLRKQKERDDRARENSIAEKIRIKRETQQFQDNPRLRTLPMMPFNTK